MATPNPDPARAGLQVKIVAEPIVCIDDLPAQVGILLSPSFRYSHMPSAVGALNMMRTDQGAFRCHHDLGFTTPAMVPVVWNQDGSTDNGRPGLSTTTTASAGVQTSSAMSHGGRQFRENYTTNYARVADIADWDDNNVLWEWAPHSQTVTFCTEVGGGYESPALAHPPLIEHRWNIGTVWYKLSQRLVGDTSVHVSYDNGSNWERYHTIPTTAEWSGTQQSPLTVTLMGDVIGMGIGSDEAWLSIPRAEPKDGPIAPEERPTTIEAAQTYVQSFSYAQGSLHPRGWRRDVCLLSSEINTGIEGLDQRADDVQWSVVCNNGRTYVPSSTSEIRVQTAPGYPTANGLIAYELKWMQPNDGTWQGYGYGMAVTGVRYVNLYVPAVKRTFNVSRQLEIGGIKSVQINKTFDPSTLTVRSRATVVCNNFNGAWTSPSPVNTEEYFANPWRMGSFAASGHRAGSLQMRLATVDQDNYAIEWAGPGDKWGEFGTRVSGIAGSMIGDTNVGDEYNFWFSIDDLMAMMHDQDLYFRPFMDGWCHYYAVAWCLEQAHLDPDRHLHPDVPRCSDPYCSNPDHYHLPMGDGGHPLLDPGACKTPGDMLQMVQHHTSHLAFFDCMGRLVYAPWNSVITDVWNPLAYMRYYTLDQTDMSGMERILAHVQSISSTINIGEVRNAMVTAGIDAYGPRWLPIVARRESSASIDDPGHPGYKGYRSTVAWLDTQFATQDYVDTVAGRFAAVLGKPVVQCQLTAVGDPWIEPLARFQVMPGGGGKRTNARNFTFFVVGTTESWDYRSRDYRMTLQAMNVR